MPGPVAVRARGWGWRHATRRAWAVRDLDLDVAPGERVLLLGASGSGKSTLLAGLAGLLDGGTDAGTGAGAGAGTGAGDGTGEEEGALLLDGVPARRARLAAVGAGVGTARTGLLLQDPQAQTVLARCGDDVAFGLENHAVPREQIWPRVDDALAAVGFPYGRDHSTARLSGGERQRLALAGVLALRPGLLLLDEPTAMLDPDGEALLREQAAAVLDSTGATCVLVEHRVAPWLDLVDRVVVLTAGGGLAADGPPCDVLGRRGAELAAAGIWVPDPHPLPHLPHLPRDQGIAHGGPGRSLDDQGEVHGDRGVVALGWGGLRAELLDRGGVRRRNGAELLDRGGVVGVRGVAVRRAGLARPAVRDVDLDLRSGRALAVVGPNGAGKSSLALALAGLTAPSAGEVRASAALTGQARSPFPHRWRPRELVTRIGTVFQEPQHQFVARTCAAELAVGPRRAGLPAAETDRRVAELLERLRLAPLARANPFTLSGGEQRRLSVATALATRPRVLVLDEPTFGQDARTWSELVSLFHELLAEGIALVAVTHDDALVRAVADDVLELRDGAPVGPARPPAREPSREPAREPDHGRGLGPAQERAG